MDSSFPCLIAKRMQETQAIQGVLGLRQVETWTICGWFPARKPLISGTLDGSSKVEFSKLCHSISSWFVKNKKALWMMDDDNPYSWYFSKIPKSIQDSSTYHHFPNSMIGLAEVLRHPFLSPMRGADRNIHNNGLISMVMNQLLWAHVQLNRLDRI